MLPTDYHDGDPGHETHHAVLAVMHNGMWASIADPDYAGGALPDGSDSIPAIQATRDALLDNGGGAILVPPSEDGFTCSSSFLDLSGAGALKPMSVIGVNWASKLIFTGQTDGIYASGPGVSAVWVHDLTVQAVGAVHVVNLSHGSDYRVERCNLIGGDTLGVSASAAVYMNGATRFRVAHNLVTGCGDPSLPGDQRFFNLICDTAGSSDGTFEDNDIVNSHAGYGIASYNGNRITCHNNRINMGGAANGNGSNSGDGITFYQTVGVLTSQGCTFTANRISECAGFGIRLQTSTVATVQGNTLVDCCSNMTDASLPAGAIGFYCPTSMNAMSTINGNTIITSGLSGVAVQGDGVTVEGNTITTCTHAGISIRDSDGNLDVIGNVIKSSGYGIQTFSATLRVHGARILGNEITSVNNQGIQIDVGWDCTIADNKVRGAANIGIYVKGGADNILHHNTATHCVVGIRDDAARTRWTDNITRGNSTYGIQAAGTDTRMPNGPGAYYRRNGAAGSRTGSVDVTAMSEAALNALNGLTLVFAIDGGSNRTCTFSTPDNWSQVLSQIDEASTDGYEVDVVTGGFIRIMSETGGTASTVQIVSGTAMAALGFTASTGTGSAPTTNGISISATGALIGVGTNEDPRANKGAAASATLTLVGNDRGLIEVSGNGTNIATINVTDSLGNNIMFPGMRLTVMLTGTSSLVTGGNLDLGTGGTVAGASVCELMYVGTYNKWVPTGRSAGS